MEQYGKTCFFVKSLVLRDFFLIWEIFNLDIKNVLEPLCLFLLKYIWVKKMSNWLYNRVVYLA